MMRMAERHGLLARLRWRASRKLTVQRRRKPTPETQNEDRAENRDARKSVRAVMKNLGHIISRVPACYVRIL